MMNIADCAREGSSIAEEALRELILEATDRGESLPIYLRAVSMDFIRGGRRGLPGRKPADTYLRDIAIAVIVAEIVQRFNLRPTGRSARTRSVCFIVAKALAEAKMQKGYKAVERAWIRYGGAWAPGR
jgi:hypothetical protein